MVGKSLFSSLALIKRSTKYKQEVYFLTTGEEVIRCTFGFSKLFESNKNISLLIYRAGRHKNNATINCSEHMNLIIISNLVHG